MKNGHVSAAHLRWETKAKVFETIGYEPFGAQPAFHASIATHRMLAAGNQSGKTHAASREILPQILLPIFDPRINAVRGRKGWIVVPRYALADPITNELHSLLQGRLEWTRKKRATNLKADEYHYSIARHEFSFPPNFPLEEGEYHDETRLAKLWIKSADEPAGLHAQPLDYIVIDEAGGIPFEVYQVNLIPRLTVTGGWIAAVGTFEDTTMGQWFVDYWRIGQSPNEMGIASFRHPTVRIRKDKDGNELLVPVNPFVDAGWAEQQRSLMDPDLFGARFLAIPKPNERLVFRRFSYVRHVSPRLAEFDPNLPVYLGIDPGGVYAVVAFQIKYVEGRGDVVAVIDEIYDRGAAVTDDIAARVRAKEWYSNIGIDGSRRMGAVDIAAKESWQVWGRNGFTGLARNRVNIEVGNDNLRALLYHDRLVVHPRCRWLLDEFSRYSYPQVTSGRDPLSRTPSDEYNHAIKGLIYGIIAIMGYWDKRPAKRRGIPGRRRGIL